LNFIRLGFWTLDVPLIKKKLTFYDEYMYELIFEKEQNVCRKASLPTSFTRQVFTNKLSITFYFSGCCRRQC
jgi:hypothetical protein